MLELGNIEILPSEFAEQVGIHYSEKTSQLHKKTNGQFFTSKSIADFMGSIATPRKNTISILDPGCGTAILSCAIIEQLIQKSTIQQIHLTLYESDHALIPETKKVLDNLRKWLTIRNIEININLKETDFIFDNSSAFASNSLFDENNVDKYDYVISNPPYFKISKSDKRAKIANELVYGQPNIYSLFLGLSAKLLNPNGELVFITPRSFAAGNYFKAFRHSFFSNVNISRIHIFESRNKAFKTDKVLQENIIIKAVKNNVDKITVSVSKSDSDLDKSTVRDFNSDDLIDLSSKDKILFIPSNNDEAIAIDIFRKWKNKLNDYDLQISTGPVVAFRCVQYFKDNLIVDSETSPLIWLHNVKEMQFVYPLKKGNKPMLMLNDDASKKVLVKNKNYILIRRFSSKDDKSRLVCCPYFENYFNVNEIGLENHLNYIHRPNGILLEDEVVGIATLFNSTLFDTYFRTFNGNTQVGATELKQISLPPLAQIKQIGNSVKNTQEINQISIDKIVEKTLLIPNNVKTKRSTTTIERIGVA